MNAEKIKILLDKYFDGETSLHEEQQLRNYILSDDVADEWEKYQPIFRYFESQQNAETVVEPVSRFRFSKHSITRMIVGIAACILIIFGMSLLPKHQQTPNMVEEGCTGTYVMIDGQCYNDYTLVRVHAAQTLDEISVSLASDLQTIQQQNPNK